MQKNRLSYLRITQIQFTILLFIFLYPWVSGPPPQLIPRGFDIYRPGDAPVAPRILTQQRIKPEIVRLTTESQVRPYH